MPTTCPAPLILLDLISLTMYGEAYNLWGSPLCSLQQPPGTSSFLYPNILFGTLFSDTLSVIVLNV